MSVPAKQGQFDLAVYVESRVKPQVTSLLPSPADWPAFQTALLAAVLDKPALRPAIEANPNSALVAVIKCARLGLSLNPIDKHFALVPRKGVIQGEVQYQGWQHLAMGSSAIEWMHADVVYKQEQPPKGTPFLDPVTNRPNHEAQHFERDNWKDDDIVGAYCTIKLKGHERHITRVLSRTNLNKRRAMAAENSGAWINWFAGMCAGKAIKACCQSEQVPKTKQMAMALAMEPDLETVLPTKPTPIALQPVAPDAPRTGGQVMFQRLEEQPLPSDEELASMHRAAIEVEVISQSLEPEELDALIHQATGAPLTLTQLNGAQLQQTLDALVHQRERREGTAEEEERRR